MQIFWRSFLLTAVGGPLMTIYLLINHRENVTHRIVEMPDWVPFWPVMTIPYLLMLIGPWFLAYFIKDQRLLYQYLVTVLLAFLVVGGIWYFFPTEMTRPPTPDGWLNQIHRDLIAVDNPVCIVPCGHVITPIAIICCLANERPKWLLWMLPLLAFGMLSVATTWQHRPVDLVTGTIISLVAVIFTKRLFKNAPQGSP